MLNNKSISLLVASVLLVLPVGIATASDIDVQTGNVRVVVDKNNGVSIQSQPTGALVTPPRGKRSSIVRRSSGSKRYPINASRTRSKVSTRCHSRIDRQHSTSTSGSGRSVAQTSSSTSTTVCR